MSATPRRRVIPTSPLAPLRLSARGSALLATCLFVQVTSGCVSNEYVIPHQELQRVTQLPPEIRGHHVGVVQEVGERRDEAVAAAPAPAQPDDPYVPNPDVALRISVDASGGGSAPARGNLPPTSAGFRGAPPSAFHGTPTGGAFHGTPVGGGGFHGVPAGGGFHGGGGGWRGGGGGGGKGDAAAAVLVVVVVAVVVMVVAAGVSLAAAEAVRFDGYVDIPPGQLVHLKDAAGRQTALPLGDLTPADAAVSVEAKVMDDEGLGIYRLERAPLHRKGPTFKLDLGTTAFNYGSDQMIGMASHIQIGGFVTPTFGLMVDVGLAGGSDCCGGTTSVTRHSLALEAQSLPLALGPLHLGAFASGGIAIASGSDLTEEGPIAAGGALVELALTSRFALTFRAGASAAHLPSGWSTAGSLTGGFALY